MRIPDSIIFNSLPAIKSTIADLNFSSLFIIVDHNTKKYCLPSIQPYLPDNYYIITISDLEKDKNISTCNNIWSELLDKNADRYSLIINLGGGLISDIGGFTASTFKRGIRFINFPTTLLSMVDAAFGGKTGINFSNVKNQIGVFSNAINTFLFPDFLKTLDNRQLMSGFGEILKYGLGFNKNLWNQLESIKTIEKKIITEQIICECIDIKLDITEQDSLELNKRKLLNLGHTVGHALESYFMNSSNSLLHGEAVAWGLLIESMIAYHSGLLKIDELEKVKKLIFRHFSKPGLDKNAITPLIEFMLKDKKNNSDRINFTLPLTIGQAKEDFYIETSLINKTLIEFISL